MFSSNDIRVVVSIDFGSTYSGYAYSNKTHPQIITNSAWPGLIGKFKINTVLQYDENFKNVKYWGHQALSKKPSGNNTIDDNSDSKDEDQIVELFKLHLSEKIPVEEQPKLPDGLDSTKAITDYLHIIGSWPGINFKKNVLLILTVPSEWSEQAKHTMRKCAYDAKLTNIKSSSHLQIITEPEAAAIYCRKLMRKKFFRITGKKYLIVDCGGGTVDLTMRQLLPKNRLGEVTECSGDLCGGSFVDLEFVKYIGRKVGVNAIKSLKEKKYGQYQYMIQRFCDNVKFKFDGGDEDVEYDFDIEEICPALKDYIADSQKDQLKEDEWLINLDYETIKSFFDPVIGRIIRLIRSQLEASNGDCSAIFLVGGFSESLYLKKRIKEEFKKKQYVSIVSVPSEPACAIVRGAVEYGLNKDVIKNRVLKYNYGIVVKKPWTCEFPVARREECGNVRLMRWMATKGQQVKVGQKFSTYFRMSHEYQTHVIVDLYISDNITTYSDEPGVYKLGKFTVEVPDVHLGKNRRTEYELCFDQDEITATTKTHNV
ncbi:942_t:CDS:2 [Entrophospora sp. SA101]|nr:942_t:CDS:2 [Entrophospora sp. SA101]